MVNLNSRLSAAASLVRPEAVAVDIGTDHAFLPIYLIERGIARFAAASDINEGPIERAKSNIREAGLENKIKTLRCDGLNGIEIYSPTDIIITGMGGDLITEIIERAPFVKNSGIRLILQPMTRADILRNFLTAKGFSITEELLVQEGNKIYQVFACSFSGITGRFTPLEALAGKLNLENGTPLCHELLKRLEERFSEIIKGKSEAGLYVEYEKAVLEEIENHKFQI